MIAKFAIRSILKRPFLNLVKITGLSLALSGILVIILFLKNELTFDSWHSRSDRIYRFTITDPGLLEGKHFARIFRPGFVPAMAANLPEIETFVRLVPVRGGVMKHNENFITVTEAFECDSTFFEVFDARLLSGDPHTILNSPGSMVVFESFAKKIFGNANPVGEILTLPDGQFYGKKIDFTIKGIMKDFPGNSHFHPEFITTPVDKTVLDSWAWTYLLLSKNADPDKIISGFSDFFLSLTGDKELKIEAHLQKISEIHLHSSKLREIETGGNMSVIYILAIAAFLLLFIAITNYSNLNIGMAGFSNKYLFISKVSGSSAWMTLQHFLFESSVIVISSVAISVVITAASLIFIMKTFSLNLFTGNLALILAIIAVFSLLSILGGILPVVRQGIQRISSADHRTGSTPVRKGVSKSIIVLQYAIATALIIGVIVIQKQTNLALNTSMGAGNENLICFENVHTSVQQKFEVFKQELLKYNSIESVSAMFEPPGGEANDMMKFKMEGYTSNESLKNDDMIGVFPCDYSMAEIFRLNFLAGETFSGKNEDYEGSGEYIINESAMKRLHYTDPGKIVGAEFQILFDAPEIKIPAGNIIGVIEDFHLSGIRKVTEPLVLFKRKDLWLINFVVAYRPGMQTAALDDIEGVWTKMFPEYPFQYAYVNSMYRNIYKTELLEASLLSIFTLMALFICSMGLLGMSLLTTKRRTKEIGIRKINGASTGEMMIMINWDFIKWIILSFALAIPFAYYAMNRWLESFAYRISLGWEIFVLACLSTVVIATITVSVQSWKASSTNPVEALRYE